MWGNNTTPHLLFVSTGNGVIVLKNIWLFMQRLTMNYQAMSESQSQEHNGKL